MQQMVNNRKFVDDGAYLDTILSTTRAYMSYIGQVAGVRFLLEGDVVGHFGIIYLFIYFITGFYVSPSTPRSGRQVRKSGT